ncbi:hypothetical protein NQZ68_013601 [Dissostichus eleginoides]|nr:hypothetical protein NQZ68_013601 [Dissostichus eleginoides]
MTPVVQFITLHPAPLLPQEQQLPLNQGDGEGEKQSEIMSVRIPEMRRQIVFRKESHFSGGSDKLCSHICAAVSGEASHPAGALFLSPWQLVTCKHPPRYLCHLIPQSVPLSTLLGRSHFKVTE